MIATTQSRSWHTSSDIYPRSSSFDPKATTQVYDGAHFLFEMVCNFLHLERSFERIPEPDATTEGVAAVAGYVAAVERERVMDPVYLFHGMQILRKARAHDTILDLGCGPGGLTLLLAECLPEAKIIGVDLSANMLAHAQSEAQRRGLTNVTFVEADFSTLTPFADQSIDLVTSTLALHHLPDEHALKRTLQNAKRVLRADGGLYLADLAALGSERACRFLALEHSQTQPEAFTWDYYHSLRAAFPMDTVAALASTRLPEDVRCYGTWPNRYAFALANARLGDTPASVIDGLKQRATALAPAQRRDYRLLQLIFGLGGLSSR